MVRSIVGFVLLLGVGITAAPAAAQVCGDADGNGTVGVLDGVQTLREAAGLDSVCTAAACDVDGNGSVTVTDGVNVLRKAAGLAITENCGGGPVAEQPATVLDEIHTLLEIGVAFATGSPVSVCDNPADGSVEVDVFEGATTTSFSTCQADEVLLYGDVTVAGNILQFDIFEADVVNEFEDFIASYDNLEGELTFGPSGAGQALNGTVDVTTESAGTLVIAFTNAVVTGGVLTSGTANVDLADSDLSEEFTSLALTFDGSGFANVTATAAGGGTSSFRLEIATGTVTQ